MVQGHHLAARQKQLLQVDGPQPRPHRFPTDEVSLEVNSQSKHIIHIPTLSSQADIMDKQKQNLHSI